MRAGGRIFMALGALAVVVVGAGSVLAGVSLVGGSSTLEAPSREVSVEVASREISYPVADFLSMTGKKLDEKYIVDEYTLPTFHERVNAFLSSIKLPTLETMKVMNFYVSPSGLLAVKDDNGAYYIFSGRKVVGIFPSKDKKVAEKLKEYAPFMTIVKDKKTELIGLIDHAYVPYENESGYHVAELSNYVKLTDGIIELTSVRGKELKYQVNEKGDIIASGGITVGKLVDSPGEAYAGAQESFRWGITLVGKVGKQYIYVREI